MRTSHRTHEQELLDLFDRWAVGRDKTHDPATADERIALQRLLDAWDEFDLMITYLYDMDLAVAADVQRAPARRRPWAAAESRRGYKGVFPLLVRASSRALLSRGVRRLNVAEDLGVEGLRISKHRWRPIARLRKYEVSLARVDCATAVDQQVDAAGAWGLSAQAASTPR